MSLYDGLPKSDHADPKSEKTGGWTAAGLKLLQSQIALKKAQATQAMRERTRAAAAVSTSVAPVVDLSSKGKEKEQRSTDSPPAKMATLLKPRKALVVDGPPLSFIPTAAKEEHVVMFGEFTVEDEYQPMVPNDYMICAREREIERQRKREEDNRREIEDAKRRAAEKLRREEELEAEREVRKRQLGAAIAPPQALVEHDKKVLEEPIFPSMAAAPSAKPKGLGLAAKMMEKMGYKQGAGLGKSGQGMTQALQVEKIGAQGKIIHEADLKREIHESEAQSSSFVETPGFAVPDLPPAHPAAPPAEESVPEVPITEVLKKPTKVVLLRNMVGRGEVDDELEPEVKEEMTKFGEVLNVLIYELPSDPSVDDSEAIRIFAEFGRVDHAIKAVVALNGRYFGGRTVKASFYDVEKFKQYQLAE